MGKTVLDMGCGTGVLAILASRKGAAHVTAIDNDPWAYENSIENVQKNNVSNCNVILGDASSLGVKRFDLILANINRNILLEDIPRYAEALDTRGMLAVSGFYEADNRAVIQTALSYGLFPWKSMNKGEWSALLFRRQTI
jgi:ribosomal protein L11 methyltransferase